MTQTYVYNTASAGWSATTSMDEVRKIVTGQAPLILMQVVKLNAVYEMIIGYDRFVFSCSDMGNTVCMHLRHVRSGNCASRNADKSVFISDMKGTLNDNLVAMLCEVAVFAKMDESTVATTATSIAGSVVVAT